MPHLNVSNGIIQENNCSLCINNEDVILFIDIEEAFKNLDKAEDGEIRIFAERPERVGLKSKEHCDAILITEKNQETQIKLIELTLKQDRYPCVLFNKMNFCIAFINRILRRAITTFPNSKFKYVTIYVVNPNDVSKLQSFLENLKGSIHNTYRYIYYISGEIQYQILPCSS